jgi:hypothetical protein
MAAGRSPKKLGLSALSSRGLGRRRERRQPKRFTDNAEAHDERKKRYLNAPTHGSRSQQLHPAGLTHRLFSVKRHTWAGPATLDVISVECDGTNWDGGSLFEWFLSDPDAPLKLRFRGLEEWLDVLVTALRDGLHRPVGDFHVMIEQDAAAQLAKLRLGLEPPHPEYGEQTNVGRQPAEWPAVWHARSRLCS